jgi:glyoxylase-like metal-dependent hydrolase (beta-lactamase superfamily II)
MTELLPGVHVVDQLSGDANFTTHVYLLKDPSGSWTHLHRDHVGGLKAMIGKTGATTYAHWIEASFLRGQPAYEGPGVPPAEPVEIDHSLVDGEKLDAFGGLVAYHTPGHTAGHTAYFQPDRKLLFSGDLFFGAGEKLILTTPEYTLHMGTAQISARRVAGLGAYAAFSYHGGPFPKGASAKIRALVESFG